MTQLLECERQGKRTAVMIPADEEDYIEEEELAEGYKNDEFLSELIKCCDTIHILE